MELNDKTDNLIIERIKNLNRHFSRDDIQMSNKHMRRCSTSIIIREMKIKTIIKYYLLPTRWLLGKKKGHGEDVEKLEPLRTVGRSAMEINVVVPQKIKHRITI